MKNILTLASLILAIDLVASACMAQDENRAKTQQQQEPPAQAYQDCLGKRAGETIQHRTREGSVSATCVESARGLVARPNNRPPSPAQPGSVQQSTSPRQQSNQRQQSYSLEQAISDQAQLNTIAFSGLAFLTGDFNHDTFLPPGKVSDYFGFQYMRDLDAAGSGHNTSFLTRIADNVLAILNDSQRAQLLQLAQEQESDIRHFAELRLPLMKAFRLNLEGKLPAGSSGLDRRSVMQYSADLYVLDGKLAYQRAQAMSRVLRSLSDPQKMALSRLKFGDSSTWPNISDPLDRRQMSHANHVAVMTYASEMFSWSMGSLQADTYSQPK